VIAAVNGVAAGAGASIAFACDLRIAAEGARFVLAFAGIGLIPDSGATWTLQRLVGASKAAEIALLNEPLPAEEAARIGLVTRVVPAADAAEARARRPSAAGRQARSPEEARPAGRATSTFEGRRAGRRSGAKPAPAVHAEGIAAFIEKRPPRFPG
jgi:2-(1,2-epoxy-1,2-dihydrophenyl)acetyl-CoA isomerase